jgi:hypothetical protein
MTDAEALAVISDRSKRYREGLARAIASGGGVAAMARKTGIPRGTMEKYAARSVGASFENAHRIAEAADVTMDEIVNDMVPLTRARFIPAHVEAKAVAKRRAELPVRSLGMSAVQDVGPFEQLGAVSGVGFVPCEVVKNIGEGRLEPRGVGVGDDDCPMQDLGQNADASFERGDPQGEVNSFRIRHRGASSLGAVLKAAGRLQTSGSTPILPVPAGVRQMSGFARLRRRVALLICPELRDRPAKKEAV